MKLFFRNIFKIFLIPTILAGCATTEDIKETDPVALLNKGMVFQKEGQYDRSITYFNKAIKINPRYAGAYLNRGVTYAGKAHFDKACSDFKRACKLGLCENYEAAKRIGDCK